EFSRVVVAQRLPLDARRTQRQADDDDRRQEVVLVVHAFAQGATLNAQEQGASAFGPCEAYGFEGPVPLGLRPLRPFDEDLLRQADSAEPAVGLLEELVRREEGGDV